MDSNRSRTGMLVGLAAAAGAFGVAAMMSTAAAPTARADDYSQIIAVVDADYAGGQGAFTTAVSDFGSSDFVPGLAALFDGVDDDVLSAPDNLLLGTADALTGEGIAGPVPFDLVVPANFTDGLADAEQDFSYGVSTLEEAPSDLSGGDYAAAIYADLIGTDYASIAPLEDLILGAATSL